MMSIVFIVLFPIAAMSLHLPLRGVRVVQFIHAPIQIVGLAMMIGALGLGIDIAKNDLHYLDPAKNHVIIGLLATSMIIFFQPAMGIWQHLHYQKTGQKTIISYAHRWIGRIAIILGWINTGLGFQLLPFEVIVTHVIVREYVLLGLLGGLWFFLVGLDGVRSHLMKKQKISAFRVGWKGKPTFQSHDQEKQASEVSDSAAPDSRNVTGVRN